VGKELDLLKEKIEVLKKVPTPYQKASCFWDIVKHELEICQQFLDPEESEQFRKYYNAMVNADHRHLLYHRDRSAQVQQYLIGSLAPGIKVLDAGCGTGSESILCGILGASITGIDLSTERLAVAEKRLIFYQEQTGKRIDVSFRAQSIFDFPDDLCHVIWVQQAISHIEPADAFIKLCYQHLGPKGKLLITDDNALNPYAYFEAKKEQCKKGGTYTTKQDPKTGTEVPYAQERLFSTPSITRMLKLNGFHIEELVIGGFCPYFPLFYKEKPLAHYVDRMIGKVPLVNLFGAGYVVTAVKT
jgi:2-polyprenyl-3-methyl-5-hydroxy-6-metoxy-1,4-benzoquinol methylase